MAYTQDERHFSLATPFGKDKLLVRAFNGEERLSGLFHFHLELDSEDPALDFAQIVGKSATLTLNLADGSKRSVNGIVGRFIQAGADATFTHYAAELYPWFWLLTQTSDCRIFQHQSVPDIAAALFNEAGFSDFKNSCTGTHAARDYCVQYNESTFDFLCRLFEEEGIFYFFEHQDGKHTLVFGDDASAFATCPGAATLSYGHAGEWAQQNSITRLAIEEVVIPGAYGLDDFNFETPSTDLKADVTSSSAQNGSKRRIYHYPGGYVKKDAGEALAKRRIEAHEVPLRQLSGVSFCRALLPGTKVTLTNHPRAEVNAEHVVTWVAHSASYEGYSNSFAAFPATIPYRPPRVTPRPVIPGTQTALVVGKQGEEIWTDKYGRVAVQFHWDQLGKNNETSSCWIRVAQGWAGKSWGQIFLPRIGQEVVVSFLDGDPDRPLITGAVYNAEQTVPYTLPDEQTKSTIKSQSSKGGGGFNELRFEDKKDSEEVYFQAQKDLNAVVKNNETRKVGFETKDEGNQTVDIYNHRTVTLEEGNDSLTVKKGDRTIKVETGKEVHEVKGTRAVTVTGAETHTNEDNHTLTVKGDLTIDVTGKVTIKSGQAMNLESGAALTVKAATSFAQQAGTGLTVKAGTSITAEAGTSFTNKAGTTMTNEAAITLTNKASASQTVDGGGFLTVKGGAVAIN